jgi:hypothetical protein
MNVSEPEQPGARGGADRGEQGQQGKRRESRGGAREMPRALAGEQRWRLVSRMSHGTSTSGFIYICPHSGRQSSQEDTARIERRNRERIPSIDIGTSFFDENK